MRAPTMPNVDPFTRWVWQTWQLKQRVWNRCSRPRITNSSDCRGSQHLAHCLRPPNILEIGRIILKVTFKFTNSNQFDLNTNNLSCYNTCGSLRGSRCVTDGRNRNEPCRVGAGTRRIGGIRCAKPCPRQRGNSDRQSWNRSRRTELVTASCCWNWSKRRVNQRMCLLPDRIPVRSAGRRRQPVPLLSYLDQHPSSLLWWPDVAGTSKSDQTDRWTTSDGASFERRASIWILRCCYCSQWRRRLMTLQQMDGTSLQFPPRDDKAAVFNLRKKKNNWWLVRD